MRMAGRIGRAEMSPMAIHLASLVSTSSPPGLPLRGRARKHAANRLADQPGSRVGDDVARVGVDADQAGDLHGDARFLGGLPDRRIGCALTWLDAPPGQFPVTGVTAAHQQQQRPAISRTATKAYGTTQVAAGAPGS
jgi:hypothetical protein